MLAVVADSDTRFAAAIMRELRERKVATVVAHDYETAARLLSEGPLPSVLYVGQALRPLTGADLLAHVERSGRLAGVPTIAVVPRADSLLAIALRRGGVHTLAGAPDAADAAALISEMARCAIAAAWRRQQARERMQRLLRHVAGVARRASALSRAVRRQLVVRAPR